MMRLIRADLFRLRKSTAFWILLCLCVAEGVVCALHNLSYHYFEDAGILSIMFLMGAFLSLYIGREYSDGTIRSKIISGSTRRQIFLSRLCISFLVCSAMTLLFLIPVIVICAESFYSHISVLMLLSMLLGFFLINDAWAVICTVVSSLITSKAAGCVVSLILGFAVIAVCYQIGFGLSQPKLQQIRTANSVLMTSEEVEQVKNGTFNILYTHSDGGGWHDETEDDGTIVYYKDILVPGEPFPNPNYVREPLRTVLKLTYYMLPYGSLEM